jgi:hypothetical protein
LRRDIEEAQKKLEGEGKKAILKVDSAELEMTVALAKTAGGGGGVSIAILGVGLSGSGKLESTGTSGHKLKLVLKPIGDGLLGVAGQERR